MFSGNDTIDYPTQWALNPSAYQNMSNDQVDWGALAQQWIHMKETCPAQTVVPAPPPPPPISAIPNNAGVEGGEAPMEMEGEMEAPPAPSVTQQQWNNASSNPPVANSVSWDNQSWDTWGNWGWQQNAEPVPKRPLLPEPTYSGYSTGENNFSGYSGSGQAAGNYSNSGYWSADRGADGGNRNVRPPHAHPPPPPSSRHPQQMPRRNQRPPLLTHPQQDMEGPDTTQTIDAAKRRQLPAWIREGLEKMEREKQKQVDREREKKEREEFLRLKKIEDEKSLNNSQPDDGIPRPPAKSKFDSDSEESEADDKVKIEKVDRGKEAAIIPPLLKRSDEEVMQDIMLCVRRTLTEILLDVTTEQILSICQEEVGRIRSQTQATRGASLAGKSQALSAIGGQLGLGIYGDSSGDSESESDSTGRSTPGGKKRSSSHDVTDGQLQENIRRRKSEFEKTSREIEARLAAEEEALLRKSSVSRPKAGNSVPAPRDGDDSSGSDGEDTPSENRNEPSVTTQRNFHDRTPPVEHHDKNRSAPDAKVRHSLEKNERNDNSKVNSSSKQNHKQDSKKKTEKSSSDKKKRDKSNSSSSSSESSESSGSESVNNKSDDSTSKQSNSAASDSSESTGSSSSRSSSSPRPKKGKKKKKRTSSDESSKKDRKQTFKSKSNDGKRSKDSKNSEKPYNKFDLDEDTTQSSSKRNRDYYEQKSERSLRESQLSSRDSYARTPDRKGYTKPRYDRSRSRSADRSSGHRYESKKYSSYRNEGRSQDRSRDDRGRSRDREYRNRSRERRDSRDRRGRSRNKDRDRRENRSYRY